MKEYDLTKENGLANMAGASSPLSETPGDTAKIGNEVMNYLEERIAKYLTLECKLDNNDLSACLALDELIDLKSFIECSME